MRTIISRSCMALLFLASIAMAPSALAAEVVNINKADAAAISQNLAGIGPIKADAIVRYRNSKGRFSSIDDLQNVTGIGPALIKKNKRYLSLSKGLVKGDSKQYQAAKKAASGKKSTKSTKTKKSSKTGSAKSKPASSSKSTKTSSSKKKTSGTTSSASKKKSKSDKSSKAKSSKSKKKKKLKKKAASDS